jgi:hypothetical protein
MPWTEADERLWQEQERQRRLEEPALARGEALGFRGIFLRNFVERELEMQRRNWGRPAPEPEAA